MELVQTIQWSGELIDTLLPGTRSEWEETTMWEQREFHMAPKDHWEVNGILDFFKEWKSLPVPSILAIFEPSLDRDTWVTEFSMDLVQACKLQGELVASAMCDMPDVQPFTPTIVIKRLICQLLEQYPQLIVAAPGVLNVRACRSVQGFDHASSLFKSVLASLTRSLTVIIDRIDCCEIDATDINDSQDLVEFLSQLVESYPPHRFKVIITTGDDLPKGESLSPGLAISTCTIASRIRPARRDAVRPVRKPVRFSVKTFTSWQDAIYRDVTGLERLYRMRKLMQKKCNNITWETKLVARTPRQKMICRYFRLDEGDPLGGGTAYDPIVG